MPGLRRLDTDTQQAERTLLHVRFGGSDTIRLHVNGQGREHLRCMERQQHFGHWNTVYLH